MFGKSSNVFLPDLQVVALKLKDSHLLDEILDRRCVSPDTAELYPNTPDDMVSKMCWLICACAPKKHTHMLCNAYVSPTWTTIATHAVVIVYMAWE